MLVLVMVGMKKRKRKRKKVGEAGEKKIKPPVKTIKEHYYRKLFDARRMTTGKDEPSDSG